MQEGNSLPLRAQPRHFVDKSDAGLAAALKHVFQAVNGKADVMYTRAAFRDEFADGCVIRVTLQQFYERFATRDSGNAGTIGIVQGYFRHLEHITEKRQQIVDGTHSESDVGNARTAAMNFRHVD